MSRIRIIGISSALVLAAVIGGSIIGSVAANTLPPIREGEAPAAASSAVPTPARPVAAASAGAYCEAFRAAYAAALGVAVADLGPAAAKGAQAAIDAAVQAGDLTSAQAKRLTARIAAGDVDACSKLVERLGRERPAAGVVRDGADAAAKALGMTGAELRAELRSGKDLKAIAAEKRVPYATVTAAALAPVKARLGAAVAAGTLTQAQADKILARLEANLADGRLRNERPSRANPSAAPGG